MPYNVSRLLTLSPLRHHFTLFAFAKSGNDLREFVLSIARHARHTDDLTGTYVERESAQAGNPLSFSA